MKRAAALVAILLTVASTCASARAAAAATQVVPGSRIASIADRAAHAVVTDPERALAPAFAIVDQSVPAGDVGIVPGTPQVNPSYVSIPVAITVGGRVARTLYAGYRVTSFGRTAVAARDIAPGTVLADQDLVLTRVPANGRPAVDVASLVGRKLRAAAAPGYPIVQVPAGIVDGMPIGISFFGTAFSEATLIKLASGFEAATQARTHNLPTFAGYTPFNNIQGTTLPKDSQKHSPKTDAKKKPHHM